MKKKYRIQEVFTPSQPANYTFVERSSVNKRLSRALHTPGKQLIIYGHSGAGKTTLLTNKFKSDKIDSITTRCISGMSLSEIVLDAFNQLEVYYATQREENIGGKIGGSLKASYLGLKASLSTEVKEDSRATLKRATELPINPQTLAKFIGESGKCWVIEDYHKVISEDRKQLAQVMKVFMDSSIDYPNLKIIAIGAVNSAREVVQFDPEMKSRISEIEVPLMSNENLSNIISVGEKLLNIIFPTSIIDKIVAYSSGLPAVTHQLALLVCEENEINKTHDSQKAFDIDKNTFDNALDEFLSENSDTYKSIFESATRIVHNRKVENPREILSTILSINKEQVSILDIKESIQQIHKNYSGNSLKKYVDELTLPERSEILRLNKESGEYYFSNPFIKAYCQCALRENVSNEVINTATMLQEFKETLSKELEIARKAFIRDFDLDEIDDFDN